MSQDKPAEVVSQDVLPSKDGSVNPILAMRTRGQIKRDNKVPSSQPNTMQKAPAKVKKVDKEDKTKVSIIKVDIDKLLKIAFALLGRAVESYHSQEAPIMTLPLLKNIN